MNTEPTIPEDIWRDPAFQRLPLHEQRPYLEGTVLARCAKCEARDGHDGPHLISAWAVERHTP